MTITTLTSNRTSKHYTKKDLKALNAHIPTLEALQSVYQTTLRPLEPALDRLRRIRDFPTRTLQAAIWHSELVQRIHEPVWTLCDLKGKPVYCNQDLPYDPHKALQALTTGNWPLVDMEMRYTALAGIFKRDARIAPLPEATKEGLRPKVELRFLLNSKLLTVRAYVGGKDCIIYSAPQSQAHKAEEFYTKFMADPWGVKLGEVNLSAEVAKTPKMLLAEVVQALNRQKVTATLSGIARTEYEETEETVTTPRRLGLFVAEPHAKYYTVVTDEGVSIGKVADLYFLHDTLALQRADNLTITYRKAIP